MTRLALTIALLLTAQAQAHAHSWFTGETDPVTGLECCDNRDCVEIEDTDVRQVEGGYIYRPLDNKSGPVATNPGFVPSSRVKFSKSFGYAVCIGGGGTGMYGGVAVATYVRCFFAPSGF